MKKTKEQIIESYCVPKVITRSSMELLFKEINMNLENFDEWMDGQTMFGIGEETCYFYDDVARFVNSKNND